MLDKPSKKCTVCGETKPLDLFYRNRTHLDGRKCACKQCCTKQRQTIEYKLQQRKYADIYRYTKKEYYMWKGAKRRALERGHAFDLSLEDIIIPDTCPVLGIPISRHETSRNSHNSPSLDRIDNSKGYVKGNVCVISYLANMIKSVGSADDHLKVADYIKRLTVTSQS